MYHCLSCTPAAGVYLPQLSAEVITGPTQQTARVAWTKCSKAGKQNMMRNSAADSVFRLRTLAAAFELELRARRAHEISLNRAQQALPLRS